MWRQNNVGEAGIGAMMKGRVVEKAVERSHIRLSAVTCPFGLYRLWLQHLGR